MPNDRSGFRFSLRTMLIALGALGIYVGVMGRLMIRNTQAFYAIWTVSTTIVPFVLAITSLFVISRQHESKTHIRRWAALLGMTPILGLLAWPVFNFLQTSVGTQPIVASASPSDYKTIATPLLISKYLPPKVDQPWVWNELEDRITADKLTTENADAALQVLVSYLEKKTNRAHMPWQREFLQSIQQKKLVSEKQLIPLHDAVVKKPILDLDRIRENSERMNFNINYGQDIAHSSALPFDLLWNIKSVEIDNDPVVVKQRNRHPGEQSGSFEDPLPAGEHEIEFVLDAAYVPKEKMIGLNTSMLEVSNWPKPIKKWQEKIKLAFVVHTAEEQIISLSNDPLLNPRRAVNAKLTAQNDGQLKKIILQIDIKDAPISSSFDTSVIVNGEKIPIGTCFYIRRPNGYVGSGGTRFGHVTDLPEDVAYGSVVLTPNPDLVTRYADVNEIWGQEIILKNVEIRRFDLEAGQQ